MTMAGADIHLNLQFLPALGLAIAVCVAAAVIMGIPSFRVRGMYLAIVTLAFANAAYAWLFHQRIFNGGRDAARYEPDHLRIGSLDLSDRRTYYLVCLAALVVVVLMANRLRRSGVGSGARGRPRQRGVGRGVHHRPRATKLSAFALAGGLAGFAGALLMALLTNARADQFPVDMSLSAVSMAVIGGLASAAGAVIGTLWVVGLPGRLRHQRDGQPAHLGRRAARADHVLPRRPGAGGLRHPRSASFARSSGGCPRPPARPSAVRLGRVAPRPDAERASTPPAGRARPGGAGPRRHVRRAADRRRRRPPRRPARGRRAHRRQRGRQDHDHERHRRLRPRRGPRRAARPTTSARCPPPAGPSGASAARSRTPGCSAT